jgi:hypothetical protein
VGGGEASDDDTGLSDDDAPAERVLTLRHAGMIRVRREEAAAAVRLLCQRGLNLIADVDADRIACVVCEIDVERTGTTCSALRFQCWSPVCARAV